MYSRDPSYLTAERNVDSNSPVFDDNPIENENEIEDENRGISFLKENSFSGKL
jgi:hypothetical protein